jgi:NAD-dependent SIR2 family protein deacetylase
LQDKYKLSSPEEFFYKSTFLKKPQYFYEFTKLFDLSQIKPTISHKFMNFLVSKNIVQYIFTQNIDGLEKKAKIPDDKLIFAHGNFYTGHCAKCNKSIDIKVINEGIEKGQVYYCPDCGGPCKPNVVFYGENLPDRFYDKQEECDDVDLIIIMGTSLKVQPFASVPYMTNPQADIVVFNMEKVGNYLYSKLYSNHIFIQGKTDENVIKFLKDTDMLNEFKEFVKKEYNEDSTTEEEIKKIESITKDIENLDINK